MNRSSDEEFEDILLSLGVNENEAKIITHLKRKEASMRDMRKLSIDRGVISIVMRDLEQRGWVVFKKEHSKQSRGQKYKIFTPNIKAIIKDIERAKKKETRVVMTSIKSLREAVE